MRYKAVVKSLCAVVSHLAQSLNHCSNFDQPGHVAPRAHRYYKMRNGNAQYIKVICFKPGAVFDYSRLLLHKRNYYVYRFLLAHAPYSKEFRNVYYAYATAFHIAAV